MDEGEPTRLIDDAAADPALREDLSRAARADLPSLDLDAGQARLEAAIRGGGGSGGWGGGATWGAGALAALLALGGALGWMAWGREGREDRDPSAPIEAVPAPIDPSAEAPARSDATGVDETERDETEPSDTSDETAPDDTIIDDPVTDDSRSGDPAGEPAPAPSPRSGSARGRSGGARPRPEGTLQEEMSLLAQARAALPTAPARALALADDGQRRFPSGIFIEEREAIAIQALAALGRSDAARRRASRFLRAHPSGPYTDRVRRAIAEPEGTTP